MDVEGSTPVDNPTTQIFLPVFLVVGNGVCKTSALRGNVGSIPTAGTSL